MIWELNFSYNGWQIIDSIYYGNENSINYAKVYFATYNENSDSTSIPHYEFRYFDYNQNQFSTTGFFSKIDDSYSLSRDYVKDLNTLLKLKPRKDSNEFRFEKPVVPFLLTKYGIPYNEKLNSFSFELSKSNGLILKDSFKFNNYFVERTYFYQTNVLEKVVINITNRKSGQTKEYSEIFKL